MPDMTISSNVKEWQATFEEYVKWNKRSFAEIINQKLYFVALRAMQETKTTDKGKIALDMNQPSKKYKDTTLGEILVLKNLMTGGKMPKKTATLAKNMANYVQRLTNKRASHVQFLRSGWLPAVKKLDYWNRKSDTNSISFSKRFAPKKPAGVKQFGMDKGNVKPALLNSVGPQCRGTIFNFVGEGRQKTTTVSPILQAGLDKAVKAEVDSMRIYMLRKWQEQHQRMANQGQLRLG